MRREEPSKEEAQIEVARHAILQDLRQRFKDRDSTVTAPSDISRFYQPQTNYFAGAGSIACPICGTGRLLYCRSNYNGHIKARCSTGCVAWQE